MRAAAANVIAGRNVASIRYSKNPCGEVMNHRMGMG